MRDLLLATVPLVTVELLKFYLKKTNKKQAPRRSNKQRISKSGFVNICKFVYDNFNAFITLLEFVVGFYWLFNLLYTVIAGNPSYSTVVCPIIAVLFFSVILMRLIYSLFCKKTHEDCNYNRDSHADNDKA